MLDIFIDTAARTAAITKLAQLTQDRLNVRQYAIEYHRLKAIIGDPFILADSQSFFFGLKPNLRNQLASQVSHNGVFLPFRDIVTRAVDTENALATANNLGYSPSEQQYRADETNRSTQPNTTSSTTGNGNQRQPSTVRRDKPPSLRQQHPEWFTKYGGLTDAEKKYRMDNKLCLYCRGNHPVDNCPSAKRRFDIALLDTPASPTDPRHWTTAFIESRNSSLLGPTVFKTVAFYDSGASTNLVSSHVLSQLGCAADAYPLRQAVDLHGFNNAPIETCTTGVKLNVWVPSPNNAAPHLSTVLFIVSNLSSFNLLLGRDYINAHPFVYSGDNTWSFTGTHCHLHVAPPTVQLNGPGTRCINGDFHDHIFPSVLPKSFASEVPELPTATGHTVDSTNFYYVKNRGRWSYTSRTGDAHWRPLETRTEDTTTSEPPPPIDTRQFVNIILPHSASSLPSFTPLAWQPADRPTLEVGTPVSTPPPSFTPLASRSADHPAIKTGALVSLSDLNESTNGIGTDPVTAILHWVTPDGLTSLRTFLGLANYYRGFVSDPWSTAVLSTLCRKDASFNWTPQHQHAFDSLQRAFSTRFLASPNRPAAYCVRGTFPEQSMQ